MGLLRSRKAWILAATWVLVTCLVLPASAAPYLWSLHQSRTDIVNERAVYDNTRFLKVLLTVDDEDTLAEQKHLDARGILTLLGGQYSFWNGTELVDVSETSQEFALANDDFLLGKKGIYYLLRDSKGEEIKFENAADHGLKGVRAEWMFPTLPELNGSGTIPNFRSTQEQLKTYVPYVELVMDGTNVTGVRWRIAAPQNPFQTKPLDVATQVRVRVEDRNQKRVYHKWQSPIPANGRPEGSIALDVPLAQSELARILIDLEEERTDGTYRYLWVFNPRTQSDAGVADRDGLAEPITLKAGETRDISLNLKAGYYYAWPISSPLIGDATILRAKDNAPERKTTALRFTLKGLKPGTTTLAFVYGKDEGNERWDYIYNITPIKVVVTDASGNVPGGSSGSSGGGCNAGLADLALLATGTLILGRKR